MPRQRDDDRLIDAIRHNSDETLAVLRDMSVTLGKLYEQNDNLRNLIRFHMGALVGIIILLIIGVFKLVSVKLQYPSIPIGP
tara:strand:+ start:642 stop:887 length:246 start_codon:yes stop_codon:yes gene_type:complete